MTSSAADHPKDQSRAHAAWRDKSGEGASFGGWLTLPSMEFLSAMEGSELDYVGIDCQHGQVNESDVVSLLTRRAFNKPILVRVSANRAELIGRVVDAGADGVIVPAVNSADEARAIVSAVRFSPDGVRSYGPIASHLPRDPEELAARVFILPMIETEEGVLAVDEILSVPGVDGVYVGPADMGLALGLGWRQFPPSPALLPTLKAISQAADRAGKVAAVHAGSEHFARVYSELGFRLITLGIERSFLAAGVRCAREIATTAAGEREGAVRPYG